jgi:hypothetical protein
MNSRTGTLQQINGSSVMIDSIWYDGANVAQYLPNQLGITVEYNASEQNVLAFIREKKAYGGGGQQGGGKPPYTPKNTQRANYSRGGQSKSQSNPQREASIIKQVIFKGAIELARQFTYDQTADMLGAFDEIYAHLEQKYADRLK